MLYKRVDAKWKLDTCIHSPTKWLAKGYTNKLHKAGIRKKQGDYSRERLCIVHIENKKITLNSLQLSESFLILSSIFKIARLLNDVLFSFKTVFLPSMFDIRSSTSFPIFLTYNVSISSKISIVQTEFEKSNTEITKSF